MSNIANPTRTDRGGTEATAVPARAATALAVLLLTVAIISFRPFQPAGAEGATGGDLVNQLGYGLLGALAACGLLTLTNRRVLAALLSPWWLLLLVLLSLSVMHAPSPPEAMRAALFTLIGILVMATVLILPPDADGFSTVLATVSLAVLGLCYYGIVARPDVAIHGAGGLEPQHAGLWRGSFSHKNIAAPVMACLAFMGLYLWRRHWRWSGGTILVLALFFIANTGSKTTLGTVPLAMLLVILPGLCGLRFLAPVFLVAAIAGAALATLGIALFEPLSELQRHYFPGLTYTGRTELWAFMGEMLAERPWTGYGLESFWGSDLVRFSDQPFDRAWDIRGIVHGHNAYMDLAIAMGLPALLVAIIAFILAPMRDYLRVPPLKENVLLADLFLMIVAFTLLDAFLESFFFRRADPVWLLMVFAIFGLRLVARFPVSGAR
ncbi:O-antigen ligase [Chelativorans sp. M5D2P16]|uniref:O-antigen ligase family protein n=1 Tax=Chelativorans sp. M5D2P16 TaxID=3095678 RepID=UPI002ACAD806|nr:O-antigen ligase [Chelativorans sp. M5D2P16]MDZ5698892.1 O-antigen ligase [Chelativorans sp. M5D2P16]